MELFTGRFLDGWCMRIEAKTLLSGRGHGIYMMVVEMTQDGIDATIVKGNIKLEILRGAIQ